MLSSMFIEEDTTDTMGIMIMDTMDITVIMDIMGTMVTVTMDDSYIAHFNTSDKNLNW